MTRSQVTMNHDYPKKSVKASPATHQSPRHMKSCLLLWVQISPECVTSTQICHHVRPMWAAFIKKILGSVGRIVQNVGTHVRAQHKLKENYQEPLALLASLPFVEARKGVKKLAVMFYLVIFTEREEKEWELFCYIKERYF